MSDMYRRDKVFVWSGSGTTVSPIPLQDEELLRRERELKDLSSKLESTQQQLDDLRRRGTVSSEELLVYREKEARWEGDRRTMQVGSILFQLTNA